MLKRLFKTFMFLPFIVVLYFILLVLLGFDFIMWVKNGNKSHVSADFCNNSIKKFYRW